MDNFEIPVERVPEVTETIRRFASLSPARLEMALLIMRGIQIGEDIASGYNAQSRQSVRPNA